MLSPACGVFIMQYASNAHAASARSYEFGMNSLSRWRERAGVRGASSSSAGPHPHPPPAGEGTEAGEVNLFPLWLPLLPPLGEGRDGGLPALRRAAVALHYNHRFSS